MHQTPAMDPMPPRPLTTAPTTARTVSGAALDAAQPITTGPLICLLELSETAVTYTPRKKPTKPPIMFRKQAA
jgi:hypothetical protein